MISIHRKFLLIFFCGLISAQHVAGSNLEYVKIETESTGVSVKEAIDSALVQAIERVNGKSMESSSFLKTIEISEQKNNDSNYFSSQEYQDEIQSKSKGQIKRYDILSKTQNEINKSINYFIQVNIGNENQKSGIPYNEVDAFYNYCTKENKMNVLGLMAIPPNDNNSEKYFKSLSELNASLALKELSMGMSSDYMDAIKHKATYLRIGSLIFGERS